MKIFELSHIGEFHINHNEDFLVSEEVGEAKRMIAVMDGCSSGTDSHFASALIGKVLRKLAKQEAYREYAQKIQKDIAEVLEYLAIELFDELVKLNRQLDLRSDEILSTLILALIDSDKSRAEVLVVGDGMVHFNGENFEYENDNKPDYVGYHLKMDKLKWFDSQTQKLSFVNLKELVIATDGIHTFKNIDGKEYKTLSQDEIMYMFFESMENVENENKLKKTLINIKKQYGLVPTDDLTMIRVIN